MTDAPLTLGEMLTHPAMIDYPVPLRGGTVIAAPLTPDERRPHPTILDEPLTTEERESLRQRVEPDRVELYYPFLTARLLAEHDRHLETDPA